MQAGRGFIQDFWLGGGGEGGVYLCINQKNVEDLASL